MRRASASDDIRGAGRPVRRPSVVRGFVAGALALSLMAGAPASAFAADDSDDDDDRGQLGLNTAVLVDESVGTETAGDFAIRSALFSDDLAANVLAQQLASAEKLRAVEELDFSTALTSNVDYGETRATLFADYSSVSLTGADGDVEKSTVAPWVMTLIAAPVVIGVGAFMGMSWTRRKRGKP